MINNTDNKEEPKKKQYIYIEQYGVVCTTGNKYFIKD